MNKRQLYENIMRNVSHEVKKALNELYQPLNESFSSNIIADFFNKHGGVADKSLYTDCYVNPLESLAYIKDSDILDYKITSRLINNAENIFSKSDLEKSATWTYYMAKDGYVINILLNTMWGKDKHGNDIRYGAVVSNKKYRPLRPEEDTCYINKKERPYKADLRRQEKEKENNTGQPNKHWWNL